MFSQTGGHTAVSGLPAWHILFAREPEEDVELDQEDTEETSLQDEGDDPPDPDGGGRRKLLMLTLLAVLAGGGLYLAMDPDTVMNLMGAGPEPAPMPPPPNRAPAAPPAPAPVAPAPPETSMTGDAPQDMAKMPAPSPVPPKAGAPAAASAPPPSSPASQPAPPKPSAPAGASPVFFEGQAIVVLSDPAKPAGPVALMADPDGSRPGPSVAPNTPATVLDGERRSDVWVYAIRTAQGATGWIVERQLKATP